MLPKISYITIIWMAILHKNSISFQLAPISTIPISVSDVNDNKVKGTPI
jgi:hypothetical protein